MQLDNNWLILEGDDPLELSDTNGLDVVVPAIWAGKDYCLGRYAHPLTSPFIHLYQESDLSVFADVRTGWVSFRAADPNLPRETTTRTGTNEVYSFGKALWQGFELSTPATGWGFFRKYGPNLLTTPCAWMKERQTRLRAEFKHELVMHLLQGRGLRIQLTTSAHQGAAQEALAQLALPYEEAMARRAQSMGNAQTGKRIMKAAYEGAQNGGLRVNEGQVTDKDGQEITLVVTIRKGKKMQEVPFAELPAGYYDVMSKSGNRLRRVQLGGDPDWAANLLNELAEVGGYLVG